jgi:hypothetical protein
MIEILAFRWLTNSISPAMVCALADASTLGIHHFATSRADDSTAPHSFISTATALNTLANTPGALPEMVKEAREALGLDENGRAFKTPGRARDDENRSAQRMVSEMAGMVNTLLETNYLSNDLYPSSGGRFDHNGRRKMHTSENRPCQVCEQDVCPDYDHSCARTGACFCGLAATQHWKGASMEQNRDHLIWELSNKLYPQLQRINAQGKLKAQWYENAKCGDCRCTDFGLYGAPGADTICDSGHAAARYHGDQPGDWVLFGASELLVLAQNM